MCNNSLPHTPTAEEAIISIPAVMMQMPSTPAPSLVGSGCSAAALLLPTAQLTPDPSWEAWTEMSQCDTCEDGHD